MPTIANAFKRFAALFKKRKSSAKPKKERSSKSFARGLNSVIDSKNTIGLKIVDFEARRDSDGNPKLYALPKSDGGGAYEIAGINSRYHPEELVKLRAMPASEREAECARYIEDYTRKGTGLRRGADYCRKGTLFFILDTAFNRGAGGASRIVQAALVSLGFTMKEMGSKGWGSRTRAILAIADRASADDIIPALRKSRESYERNVVGVRSLFWRGLVNRWDNAEKVALDWNQA